MREIEFRQAIYSKDKFDHWHYWGLIGNAFIGIDTGLCSPKTAIERSQQYIGLKDKNGKEIYGDDIVKICNHKCQLQIFEAIGRVAERYSAWGVTDLRIIKFEKYSPKTKPQDATDIMYFLNIFDHKHIEIIGTIHTTPELLEKSK